MEVIGANMHPDFGEKEFDYRGDYVIIGPDEFVGKLLVSKSLKGGGKPG